MVCYMLLCVSKNRLRYVHWLQSSRCSCWFQSARTDHRTPVLRELYALAGERAWGTNPIYRLAISAASFKGLLTTCLYCFSVQPIDWQLWINDRRTRHRSHCIDNSPQCSSNVTVTTFRILGARTGNGVTNYLNLHKRTFMFRRILVIFWVRLVALWIAALLGFFSAPPLTFLFMLFPFVFLPPTLSVLFSF